MKSAAFSKQTNFFRQSRRSYIVLALASMQNVSKGQHRASEVSEVSEVMSMRNMQYRDDSIEFTFISFRRRASPGQYMIFVTILSISLNCRKFFELQLNKSGDDYETTSLMEYPPYIVFSNTWQELLVTGSLPFVVLMICNTKIYLKIRESSKHESHR